MSLRGTYARLKDHPLLPWVVLLVGLGFTAIAGWTGQRATQEAFGQQFNARVAEIRSGLDGRILRLDTMLQSLAAYDSAVADQKGSSWDIYAENLKAVHRMPGLVSVGHIRRSAQRGGDEPIADPKRREAIDYARRTGEFAMTGFIPRSLGGNAPRSLSVIAYRTVYRRDAAIGGGQRPRIVTGYVSALLDARGLLEGLLHEDDSGYQVRIRDLADHDGISVVYAPGPASMDGRASAERAAPGFQSRHGANIGGHAWEIEVTATAEAVAHRSRVLLDAPLIVVGGAVLSLAGALVVGSLAERRRRQRRGLQLINLKRQNDLQTIINTLPSPMFVKDERHRWILVNRAFCEMHGLPSDALLGSTIDSLSTADFAVRINAEDDALFESGSTVEGEVQRRIAGEDRWYLLRKTCVTLLGGTRIIVGLLVDIDRQKRAEGALLASERELREHQEHLQHMVEQRTRELAMALSRAEAANRAKSEFLANMSHELRTPLHAILSFAKLGIEKTAAAAFGKSRLPQYFSRIQASGQRLLALLNDLLDLSKLEAGRMPYAMAEHDLAESLREALDEFEAVARAKKIRIAVAPAPASTRAWFDPVRVGQVVRNLLANAIRFAPEGSEIGIELAPARVDPRVGEIDALALTISDAGPGIPQAELESVFDKFVQSSTTRSGAGGTGLGLSICREIVAAHGGRIYAANNEHGGASLTFSLPVKQGVAANASNDTVIGSDPGPQWKQRFA